MDSNSEGSWKCCGVRVRHWIFGIFFLQEGRPDYVSNAKSYQISDTASTLIPNTFFSDTKSKYNQPTSTYPAPSNRISDRSSNYVPNNVFSNEGIFSGDDVFSDARFTYDQPTSTHPDNRYSSRVSSSTSSWTTNHDTC